MDNQHRSYYPETTVRNLQMKNIPFANSYYVNEQGEIFRYKNNVMKTLKATLDNSNYLRINIKTDSGKTKKYLLHRLIAICFIPNPNDLPQVNHIDGNKLNNKVSNLEWVTSNQNVQHAFDTGLNSNSGEKNGKAILSENDVVVIYNELLLGRRTVDLAQQFSVKLNVVQKIKLKKTWDHVLKDFPDIPTRKKSKQISDSTANWVCKKLTEGLSVSEILSITTNDGLTEDIVRDIKRRKTFKNVSCNYVFK